MRRTHFFSCLIAAVALTACADSVAPTSEVTNRGLLGTVTETVDNTLTPDADAFTPLPLKGGVQLATHDTTFAVVQGVASNHMIRFKHRRSGTEAPFLIFASPASALYVDAEGKLLPPGAEVPLAVSIDDEHAVFTFGPSGSRFLPLDPATLSVNLDAIDLGRGAPEDLKLYHQDPASGEWTALDTPVVIVGRLAVVPIFHFSNYALAF